MLDGVLFFPITPFASDDSVDHGALKEHLEHGLRFKPGGIFVACGTGEFHALSLVELSDVVTTAVATTAGRVPVYAGAGGALALAKEQVRLAESAGADGILLFPPYLVNSPQAGLVAYVRAIAGATVPAGLFVAGVAPARRISSSMRRFERSRSSSSTPA